ncbi:filamentous hemagglutinin family protein [Pseudomonas sp. TE3786]
MNAHCFRLIFSKALGFLIPVAESARAQRKPGQSRSILTVSPSVLSLLLAAAPGWAVAGLVVDASSPTTVISAANGVPVINIANPNANGLSHNRFNEFDVQQPGVVFNNSQVNGVSQLGGAMLLNPNLKQTASAILTEVTGNKPSSLAGTLEVFGGKADLLIANPEMEMHAPDIPLSPMEWMSDNHFDARSLLSPASTGHFDAPSPKGPLDDPLSAALSDRSHAAVPVAEPRQQVEATPQQASNQQAQPAQRQPAQVQTLEPAPTTRATSERNAGIDMAGSRVTSPLNHSQDFGALAPGAGEKQSGNKVLASDSAHMSGDNFLNVPNIEEPLSGAYKHPVSASREGGGTSADNADVNIHELTDAGLRLGFAQKTNEIPQISIDENAQPKQPVSTKSSSKKDGRELTVEDINKWLKMSYDEHKTVGTKGWIAANGIMSSHEQYLTSAGLSIRGYLHYEKLSPGAVPAVSKGNKITDEQIIAWRDMPQPQRDKIGGWDAYAAAENILLGSAYLVLKDTGIKSKGESRLARNNVSPVASASEKTTSWINRMKEENPGKTINREQIVAWRDMPLDQKNAIGGWKEYAKAQGISWDSARRALTNTGLGDMGRVRLSKGRAVSRADLLAWGAMLPQQRHQAGGWMDWADSKGIKLSNAYSLMSNKGLLAKGKALLAENYPLSGDSGDQKVSNDHNAEQRSRDLQKGLQDPDSPLPPLEWTNIDFDLLLPPSPPSAHHSDYSSAQSMLDAPLSAPLSDWSHAAAPAAPAAELLAEKPRQLGVPPQQASSKPASPAKRQSAQVQTDEPAAKKPTTSAQNPGIDTAGNRVTSPLKNPQDVGTIASGGGEKQSGNKVLVSDSAPTPGDKSLNIPDIEKLLSGTNKPPALVSKEGGKTSAADTEINFDKLTEADLLIGFEHLANKKVERLENNRAQLEKPISQKTPSSEARRKTTVDDFSRSEQMAYSEPHTARGYVHTEKISTGAAAVSKGTQITNAQIKHWQGLSPTQRIEAGGWRGYAAAEGISMASANAVLTDTGVRAKGRIKTSKGSPMSDMDLLAWNAMSIEQRIKVGWLAWSESRHIKLGSAQVLITPSGLREQGKVRLAALLSEAAGVATSAHLNMSGQTGENIPDINPLLPSEAVMHADDKQGTSWFNPNTPQKTFLPNLAQTPTRNARKDSVEQELVYPDLWDLAAGFETPEPGASWLHSSIAQPSSLPAFLDMNSTVGATEAHKQSMQQEPQVPVSLSPAHALPTSAPKAAQATPDSSAIKSMLPSFLGAEIDELSIPVLPAKVPPVQHQGGGATPAAKDIYNFLNYRRGGPRSVAASEKWIVDYAVANNLVDNRGRLALAGVQQMKALDDERKLLVALSQLVTQSAKIGSFSSYRKRGFVREISNQTGIEQNIVKRYMHDPAALNEKIEEIKKKWSE